MDRLALYQEVGYEILPSDYIRRDHVCSTVLGLLAGTTEAVLLEGQDGIGATALTTELAMNIDGPVIYFQVRGGSRVAYSLNYLVDIGLRQASEYMGPSKLTDKEPVVIWRQTLMKLEKFAKSRSQKLTIILDGMHQIPTEDFSHKKQIISDLLALGLPGVGHVITVGQDQALAELVSRGARSRTYPLQPLSEGETRELLSGARVTGEQVEEVIRAAKGHPAKLRSALRLINDGAFNPDNLGASLSSYYDQEWQRLLGLSNCPKNQTETVLAYLAHSRRPLDRASLVKLSQVESSVVETISRAGWFLEFDERTSVINFISHSHREFAALRTNGRRSEVLSQNIEQLLTEPGSESALRFLPALLKDTHRDLELVKYLVPENLELYLASTQSIAALSRRIISGVESARKAGDTLDNFRLTMQASLVRALEAVEVLPSRLIALAELGRLSEALAITQQPSTKEARFQLLSEYARVLHAKELPSDIAVTERLRTYIGELEPSHSGNSYVDIAANLLGPYPDLAIELLERASGGSKDLDSALLQLAFAPGSSTMVDSDRIERYAARVKDTKLRSFMSAAGSILGKAAIPDVQAALASMEVRDRVQYLKMWVRANSRSDNICEIVDCALSELVADTSYLPTAADLRVLASAVRKAKDTTAARPILKRIEAQQAVLSLAEPSLELIRLRLEILQSSSRDDAVIIHSSLLDICNDIQSIRDTSLRNEATVRTLEVLEEIDPKNSDGELAAVAGKLTADLEDGIELVLSGTASHLEVMKGVLKAYASYSPHAALNLISRFNTLQRRDEGYSMLATILLDESDHSDGAACSVQAISSIQDDTERAVAIVEALEAVLESNSPGHKTIADSFLRLTHTISVPVYGCEAMRLAAVLSLRKRSAGDLEEFLNRFDFHLGEVSTQWGQAEAVYRLVAAFAREDPERGERLLEKYSQQLSGTQSASQGLYEIMSMAISIAVAAFCGTVKTRQERPGDFDRLLQLVRAGMVPEGQVAAYTDIALRCWCRERDDLLGLVLRKQILPVIKLCVSSFRRIDAINQAFPAIYIHNGALAAQYVTEFGGRRLDAGINAAVRTILHRRSPWEPCSDDGTWQALDYNDAVRVVELIEYLEEDASLGYAIDMLAKSACSRGSSHQIASHQRADICRRLRDKSNRSLPDPNNIKHDGWRLFAEISIEALSETKQQPTWSSLFARAKAIPNTSDAVLVLLHLSQNIPSKLGELRLAVIAKAHELVQEIPSGVDRLYRKIELSGSDILQRTVAERLLRDAMSETRLLIGTESYISVQKDIVDSAYQIDPLLAEELVKAVDDDPARIRAKATVKRQVQMHKTREAIQSGDYKRIGEQAFDSEACFRAIRSLNSGRISPPKTELLLATLKGAALSEIRKSWPLFMWFIRAQQVRMESDAQACSRTLVPLCEQTLIVAEQVLRIGLKVGHSHQTSDCTLEKATDEYLLIGSMDREKALSYVSRWSVEIVDDEILLADPYFNEDSYDMLREIVFAAPSSSVRIITSMEKGDQFTAKRLATGFRKYWREATDAAVPRITLIAVGYDANPKKCPIHDRWLLSQNSGIKMGTSTSSAGESKLASLSRMPEDEVLATLGRLARFSAMARRDEGGQLLKYDVESV